MEILLFFMETAIVDYSNNNRVSYHHLKGFWQNIFFESERNVIIILKYPCYTMNTAMLTFMVCDFISLEG